MTRYAPNSTLADTLRAAGYVKLPSLWIRAQDMPLVHELAHHVKPQINAIRTEVRLAKEAEQKKTDPKESLDAAWAAYEQMKNA